MLVTDSVPGCEGNAVPCLSTTSGERREEGSGWCKLCQWVPGTHRKEDGKDTSPELDAVVGIKPCHKHPANNQSWHWPAFIFGFSGICRQTSNTFSGHDRFSSNLPHPFHYLVIVSIVTNLTSRSRVFRKLITTQIFRNTHTFIATRKFITTFRRARYIVHILK